MPGTLIPDTHNTALLLMPDTHHCFAVPQYSTRNECRCFLYSFRAILQQQRTFNLLPLYELVAVYVYHTSTSTVCTKLRTICSRKERVSSNEPNRLSNNDPITIPRLPIYVVYTSYIRTYLFSGVMKVFSLEHVAGMPPCRTDKLIVLLGPPRLQV